MKFPKRQYQTGYHLLELVGKSRGISCRCERSVANLEIVRSILLFYTPSIYFVDGLGIQIEVDYFH